MRNEKQALAIEHFTGPCLVIAGPGSGKTKCLVERVSHLIFAHNISPEKILVLTFSKDAADEMKARFVKQSSLRGKMPFFGTFHSFFFSVLKDELGLNSHYILPHNEALKLIKKVCLNRKVFIENSDLQNVLKEISCCINKDIAPEEFESKLLNTKFAQVFYDYRREKEACRMIDFDDMQMKVYELFLQKEKILKKWQKRFEFVLVDEVQDINKPQFLIMKLLVKPHQNLFAVGDDDQSIYAFRGAVPGIVHSFPNEFLNLKIIVLDVNYRSHKRIVAVSSRFIAHNKNRFEKEYKSFSDANGVVKYFQFDNEQKECEYIFNEIIKAEGETIGVLYRNNREGLLLSRFLERKEICYFAKECFSYQSQNEILNDVISFLGDYYHVEDNHCKSNFKLHLQEDAFVPNSYGSLFNMFRKAWGYENYLKEKYGRDSMQFEECLYYLSEIQCLLKSYQKNTNILDVLRDLKKLKMKENFRTDVKSDARVFLYTYHGSKGLEFDRVFCINVNEGIVPGVLCSEDLEEERRMFYVAITRAKHNLSVCCIKNRGGKSLSPSEFINEMKA